MNQPDKAVTAQSKEENYLEVNALHFTPPTQNKLYTTEFHS